MAYLAVAVFGLNCICYCCVRCLWRACCLLHVAQTLLSYSPPATCHFAACLIGFASGRVNWFVKQFLIETQRCLRAAICQSFMEGQVIACRRQRAMLHATWQELKLLECKARWHFYWQRGRMLHFVHATLTSVEWQPTGIRIELQTQ